MENSERLGRQARPGIEPGTSSLLVLSAEQLVHWRGVVLWGSTFLSIKVIIYIFSKNFKLYVFKKLNKTPLLKSARMFVQHYSEYGLKTKHAVIFFFENNIFEGVFQINYNKISG